MFVTLALNGVLVPNHHGRPVYLSRYYVCLRKLVFYLYNMMLQEPIYYENYNIYSSLSKTFHFFKANVHSALD